MLLLEALGENLFIYLFWGGLFQLLEATRIPCVLALQHADLCFHHCMTFLTLNLLPPFYKDPCDYIGPPWLIPDTLRIARALM